MKKIDFVLVPVMPGFGAWAVNGFIQDPEKDADSSNMPIRLPSSALGKLLEGFTAPVGDNFFVAYTSLGAEIVDFRRNSVRLTIQPLDRGGVLVSCEPKPEYWSYVLSLVETAGKADAKPSVSKSK